jgi:hypothetical protein
VCDFDLDNDGVPDGKDNCLSVPNWNQQDTDGDGLGDACDPDDDNDGVPDGLDNCPLDYNPDQYDGDGNGFGDACDPDYDHDGVYVNDNCTFVPNPSQTDTDGDGLGDACDRCPTVADWTGAYVYNKWQSPIPVPYQPDSDGDGIPDACDPLPFGAAALGLNGLSYNPLHPFKPGDAPAPGTLAGPGGSSFRIPVPLCDPSGDPDPTMITEVAFTDLDPSVEVTLLDDHGLALASLRPGPIGSDTRGLRVTPDCSRTYFLEFAFEATFPGSDAFVVQSALVPATSPNPWVTPGLPLDPPPPIPDADGDGLADFLDNCPAVYDPTGADADADGVGDVCDNCPGVANPTQDDTDLDGHGDACDCAPTDPTLFALQPEVTGVAFAGDGTTLMWDPQGMPGAGPPVPFDVVRGSATGVPVGNATEVCLVDSTPATSFLDPVAPLSKQRFYYLVRAKNGCGPGTYGTGPGGAERVTGACP